MRRPSAIQVALGEPQLILRIPFHWSLSVGSAREETLYLYHFRYTIFPKRRLFFLTPKTWKTQRNHSENPFFSGAFGATTIEHYQSLHVKSQCCLIVVHRSTFGFLVWDPLRAQDGTPRFKAPFFFFAFCSCFSFLGWLVNVPPHSLDPQEARTWLKLSRLVS